MIESPPGLIATPPTAPSGSGGGGISLTSLPVAGADFASALTDLMSMTRQPVIAPDARSGRQVAAAPGKTLPPLALPMADAPPTGSTGDADDVRPADEPTSPQQPDDPAAALSDPMLGWLIGPPPVAPPAPAPAPAAPLSIWRSPSGAVPPLANDAVRLVDAATGPTDPARVPSSSVAAALVAAPADRELPDRIRPSVAKRNELLTPHRPAASTGAQPPAQSIGDAPMVPAASSVPVQNGARLAMVSSSGIAAADFTASRDPAVRFAAGGGRIGPLELQRGPSLPAAGGMTPPVAPPIVGPVDPAPIAELTRSRRQPADPSLAQSPITVIPAAPTIAPAPVAATAQPGIDLTRDLGLHRMIDRIETLRDAADARDTRIRLIPDALGPVEVSVRRDGDTVQVHFTAAEPATRQLIADAQPRLTELAESRGVRIDRASVDGGAADGGSAGQPRPQAQPTPVHRAPASALGRPDESDPSPDRIA